MVRLVDSFLRSPPQPLTSCGYIAFLCRLTAFYAGVGFLGGLVALLAATVYALASVAPERPVPAAVLGCAVTLPNMPDDAPPLAARITRTLSDCDEGAPVAWGASALDGHVGRRR